MSDRAFTNTARVVFIGVTAGFLLIGGLIAAFGTRGDRVEGVAERWANAVSDVTRKGVGTDARDRIASHGDIGLVPRLVNLRIDHEKKSAFTALEVGKGVPAADGTTQVPLKAVYREAAEGKTGRWNLSLRKSGDSWRVVGVAPVPPGARAGGVVPSDGGPAVARAPLPVYAGMVALGLLVTIGAGVIIRGVGRDLEPLPA